MALKYTLAIAAVGLMGLMSAPAHADLSQDAAQAAVNYIGPTSSDVSGMDINGVSGYYTVGSGITFESTYPADSPITVDPSQITIQNEPNSQVPFCFNTTSGGGCSDTVDEFQFLFKNTAPVSGVDTANITGVTVDAATSSDFQPLGINLISPTEFTVNVFNLDPTIGAKMILDLTFASASVGGGGGGTNSVPETGTLILLATGLFGLAFVARRRFRRT